MARKIDHLGIAVPDLDAAIGRYGQALGTGVAHREVVEDQGVEVAKLVVGESTVELVMPSRPDSAVAKFLEKRGPGIHHVCYEVADLKAELDRLASAGVRLIDREPRVGAGGDLIAFVHPGSMDGVLTELKQAR